MGIVKQAKLACKPTSKRMVQASQAGGLSLACLLNSKSERTALLETLRKGRISGAALDVFETEPLLVDSSRRSKEWGKEGKSNVFLIPRMGYVEEGVLNRWYEKTAENLERWLKGKDLLHRLN